MVALPFAGGVARIIVKQQQGGVNIFNVLHAVDPAHLAWQPAELTALATAVRQAWVANVLPLVNSSLNLSDVVCTDIGYDTGAEATVTGANLGGVAGTGMSANTAICWSWKIARRYRGGHPRTYIGAIPLTAVTSPNTISPAMVTAHAAAATAVRAAVNGVAVGAGTARLCVVHYVRAKAILPVPLVSEITGSSVDTRLDSQRRRLGRDRT